MQRFFTVLTLTCLMLAFFVSHAAHAMPNDDVDVAEKNEETYKRRGNTAFDNVRNADILYRMAKSEYDKNAAKIERGTTVTATKLLAASVSFYVSGTLTAPILVSTYVDMVGLAGDIHASASLLSVYELTISRKQSAIGSFESAKTTYNNKYDTLVGVLATHTGWTTSEIFMYIADDENRDNGIVHKGSSGSGKHGIVGRKLWGVYDKSLPSHTCKGPCSDTFITPTLAKTSHRTKCGSGRDIDLVVRFVYPSADNLTIIAMTANRLATRDVKLGCGRSYYKCPSRLDHGDVQRHKVRECNKLVYTYDSHFTDRYTTTDCPKSYRNCMGHKYDHNNRVIGVSSHSDEADSNSDDDEDSTEDQYVAPDPAPTPTPSYHACDVHETSVSGDHSAAVCGTSGHYVCDGSDHTLQASCSVTNSNGDYCTYASFYACQSHTCVFPAPTVTCARNACGQTVSHRLAHRIDCDNCDNHYWTCIEGATHNHTTTFTCRRSGCGVTFTKCSNGVCPESSAGNYHWAAD